MTDLTIITDPDGTFLCDGDGVLTPLVINAHDVIKKIYNRAADETGAGLRESDLRAIIRDVRNLAHDALKGG